MGLHENPSTSKTVVPLLMRRFVCSGEREREFCHSHYLSLPAEIAEDGTFPLLPVMRRLAALKMHATFMMLLRLSTL